MSGRSRCRGASYGPSLREKDRGVRIACKVATDLGYRKGSVQVKGRYPSSRTRGGGGGRLRSVLSKPCSPYPKRPISEKKLLYLKEGILFMGRLKLHNGKPGIDRGSLGERRNRGKETHSCEGKYRGGMERDEE